MKIYNTLSRKKEELKTITPGEVKIYGCGPTVYNYIHIGNARPICVFDVLRRYLKYIGYKVTYVQNFTDIDDKIIKKAIEEKSDYKTVSEKYIEEYKKDAHGLNVMDADIAPKATENIDGMIKLIQELIDKGYAYVTDNGDVYFRTKKFKDYGKLSHQPIEDLESGARIAVGEIKEDPLDFALWKAAKPGEPYWPTSWGNGRPGWHIECSVMSMRYLGQTMDIHCGGQDLIFPHHENEIAQSEACTNANLANYWMHNGYINIDNQKMSKSKGNFFTVRDVADKYGYEPIRYLMIASHYRTPINYSIEIINQCKSALERLYNCKENLLFVIENAVDNETELSASHKEILDKYKQRFIDSMDDDLNSADALATIFDLVREINSNITLKNNVSKLTAQAYYDLLNELLDVLGLCYNKNENKDLDEEIEALIEKRNIARKNKDFKEADRIRDELKSRNIILEDTPNGVKWKVIS